MVVVEFGLQSSCHWVALLLHEISSAHTLERPKKRNIRTDRANRVDKKESSETCLFVDMAECESQQMLTLMVLKLGLVRFHLVAFCHISCQVEVNKVKTKLITHMI